MELKVNVLVWLSELEATVMWTQVKYIDIAANKVSL